MFVLFGICAIETTGGIGKSVPEAGNESSCNSGLYAETSAGIRSQSEICPADWIKETTNISQATWRVNVKWAV